MDDLQKLRLELYQDAAARWPDQDPVEAAERAYRFIINGSGDRMEMDIGLGPLPVLKLPITDDISQFIPPENDPADVEALEDEPDPESAQAPEEDEEPDGLSEKLLDTWLFVHQGEAHGPVKMSSLMNYFNLTSVAIHFRLKKLIALGYIESRGESSATNYRTADTPPGIKIMPAIAEPAPEPIPEIPSKPVLEPKPDKSLKILADDVARWMQSIGYPVMGRNYGEFWECKGIADLMTCRELIDWANTKRPENNMPLFEIR